MRIRFAAIVAVLPVLAAGCDSGGGGGHSTPRPSASQPVTTTATAPTSGSPAPTRTGPLSTGPGVRPGETPPVLGAAAKEHTPTGALHFAEYFVRALDWTVATNDSYLLEQISGASCSACKHDIAAAAALRRQGAYEKTGRTELVSSRLVNGTFKIRSDFVVEVVTKDEAIVIVRPSVAPSTVAPATARDDSLVFVSWHNGEWNVVEEGAPS